MPIIDVKDKAKKIVKHIIKTLKIKIKFDLFLPSKNKNIDVKKRGQALIAKCDSSLNTKDICQKKP